MGEEHITRNNPNGTVLQCDQAVVHDPHEHQANFGDYFDVYCPGIKVVPKAESQKEIEAYGRAVQDCAKDISKAIGFERIHPWPELVEMVKAIHDAAVS